MLYENQAIPKQVAYLGVRYKDSEERETFRGLQAFRGFIQM